MNGSNFLVHLRFFTVRLRLFIEGESLAHSFLLGIGRIASAQRLLFKLDGTLEVAGFRAGGGKSVNPT